MSLEITGQLIQILPVQSGTSKAGNEWSKQEFIIETQDQFPKKVCFTLFGDKVSILNGISVGDNINVAFNLESREFNGRWFHNINAWRINAANNAGNDTPGFDGNEMPPPPGTSDAPPPSADDLPF